MDQPSLNSPPAEPPSTPSVVNYAFLNHSATTLPRNLPPNVDDRPLGRHKRKRTSPEDQTVLESAYKRDPKPDKPARLEIVKQVSLGEKEVQIWFQNRRQSSRRKSRPLLPHEIAQYQASRGGNSSSPIISDAVTPVFDSEATLHAAGGSDEEVEDGSRHAIGREDEVVRSNGFGEEDLTRLVEIKRPRPTADAMPSGDSGAKTEDIYTTLPQSTTYISEAMLSDGRRGAPSSGVQSPKNADSTTTLQSTISADITGGFGDRHQHLGYLANRRSAPSLRPDPSHMIEPRTAPQVITDGVNKSSRLKKASSFVRLSMSADGNASVVTKDGSSPSPPRASQVSTISAGESHDTQSQLVPNSQENSGARSILQRSSSGRSRDSRTWEFWCDKDARTELEEKAEKEASGSAADAIGLLRSASGRSILGSVPAKRNSLLFRQPADTKRPRLQGNVPALQKPSTSAGRPPGRHLGSGSTPAKSKARPKLLYSGSAVTVDIPGNDSDKENWSPDRDDIISEDQGKPSDQYGATRSVLGDGRKQRNHGAQLKGTSRISKLTEGHAAVDTEDVDPENDPEVAAFMHSGRKSNSTSSEDELDCVQGLLSLSQGNWQ